MEWYEKPLRIAALQCNYEGGRTLQVVDRWAAMGFNTEQLFHPMADGYTALFDEKRHGKTLRAYLAKAHGNGMRVILYANVHIIAARDNGKRDAWAQRSADGTWPLLYDTHYACCFNSAWRERFFGALDSLAAYGIDGIFLDGPVVIAGGCHCASCRALYRRMHGGTLARADVESRRGFIRESKDGFLKEAYARFKKARPEAVFYINLPVMHPHASYVSIPDALAYNDLVGTEGGFMPYGPARNGYLFRPGQHARVLEAVAPDKPRVIFMAADHKPWSWYPHTPAETALCIASSVANGAGIWWGLHGSTRLLSTAGGRAAGECMRFLARHERHYTGALSAARVAALWSYDTDREYAGAVEKTDFYGGDSGAPKAGSAGSWTQAINGTCDALARCGVPYDLVTDIGLTAEKLSRWDCLVLPTCACLSDGAAAAIRGYVKRGGNLLATFDTSLYGPDGKRRRDFALADVFGASFAGGVTAYKDFNYMAFAGGEGFPPGAKAGRTSAKDSPGAAAAARKLLAGIDVPYLPAPSFGIEVKVRPGALVLARFRSPMAGRYVDITPARSPAIVRNRYGKGTCLYAAATLAEMLDTFSLPEHVGLFVNMVDALSRRDYRLPGAVNMELCVRAQEGRHVIHLVNHAGILPRPFQAVAEQAGLELLVRPGLRVKRARALAAGKALKIARDKAGDRIELPPVGGYEVVVAEL